MNPASRSATHPDLVVVGGGIVGLATAYRLLERRPELRLVVLERETRLAAHQTGHNSGVIHAGIYYAPGSLKARLCREGKGELEAFADAHGIERRQPGKLVVALPGEGPRLDVLRGRAEANGVPGLEAVGPDRMRELEPHVTGERGLWSPTTGIVDFAAVAAALAGEIQARGGSIELGRAFTGLRQRPGELEVRTDRGPLIARDLVVCAGLWADRAAGSQGPRIVPFRGDYYVLAPEARPLVRGLVYPVPDPRFPFLGVHFTPRIDGQVWAGPNAVLALARDGYRRTDLRLRDLAETLTYPGFLRLAARYWRMGAFEMWRDVSRRAYARALRRYLPELRTDQLLPGPSGVRAQALGRDGTLLDDFAFSGSGHVLHVRNAPSPAATSSLAIGRMLAERALAQFGA
jgi:(S)-2-hydroxyglutarate dehydrogenase